MKTLGWFDRWLIKIAVAKAVARGEQRPDLVSVRLCEALSNVVKAAS